jgi:hypothetical protein
MKWYVKNLYASVIIYEIDDCKAIGAKVYVQF